MVQVTVLQGFDWIIGYHQWVSAHVVWRTLGDTHRVLSTALARLSTLITNGHELCQNTGPQPSSSTLRMLITIGESPGRSGLNRRILLAICVGWIASYLFFSYKHTLHPKPLT